MSMIVKCRRVTHLQAAVPLKAIESSPLVQRLGREEELQEVLQVLRLGIQCLKRKSITLSNLYHTTLTLSILLFPL